MSFDRPFLLAVGLVVAVLLALAYRWAEQRKTVHDLAYSDLSFFVEATRPSAWVPLAFRVAWTAALACFAFALAGPHVTLPLPTHDGAVFICIDTSGSMASTDVAPTRAAAAADAASTFIRESPAGVRIGLIAFASQAAVVQPLSSDHEAVLQSVAQLPAPNGATAIGDALQLAEENLPPAGHRVIVLITDGVSNTGVDPQSVATDLGAQHIPVYTIGIGTPNGDVIGGEQSTIDEGALQSYADASGGSYARAEDATQLHDALATLGRRVSIQPTRAAVALPLAVAGGVLLVAVSLGGLALGKFP